MLEIIVTLTLVCAMVVMFVSVFLSTRKRKKQVVKDHLQYYQIDKNIIQYQIEQARNLYHVQSMIDDIHTFKYQYKKHQCPVTLQTDTNRLIRQWREKKISFEIRIAIFN